MDSKLTYRQFHNNLKEGKLTALKCKDCGAVVAPPNPTCLDCGSTNLELVQLSGKGTIRTFTVICVAPEGYKAPFVIGMAEMDEGPWLMGNVLNADPLKTDGSIIGKRVQATHTVFPADKFSAGDRVAIAFNLVPA